jgi:hypothetical protein
MHFPPLSKNDHRSETLSTSPSLTRLHLLYSYSTRFGCFLLEEEESEIEAKSTQDLVPLLTLPTHTSSDPQ